MTLTNLVLGEMHTNAFLDCSNSKLALDVRFEYSDAVIFKNINLQNMSDQKESLCSVVYQGGLLITTDAIFVQYFGQNWKKKYLKNKKRKNAVWSNFVLVSTSLVTLHFIYFQPLVRRM